MDYGFYHGFKAGEWAQNIRSGKILFQITQVDYAIDHIQGYMNNKPAYASMSKCKVWKPQKGEWCLFYYDDDKHAILAQYGMQHFKYLGNYEDHCDRIAPHIGAIPLSLQS